MSTVPQNPYYPQIDHEIDPKITVHLQRMYPALNDHDKAIRSLNAKVVSLQSLVNGVTATTTTSSSSSSSSSSGGGSSTSDFLGLGYFNDQTGQTAYSLQQSDGGILLLLGDASPVAIDLNTAIMSPFFCIISNFGTSTVALNATSPQTVNGGASYNVLKNQLCIVVMSGGVWEASSFPIVPLNTPAVPHEWLDSYDDTTGLFTQSRPDFTDLSGELQAGQLLTGTSGSLGGSAMTAGQTVSITVAITGAAVGMVAVTSPETYPGDGFVWDAYVSAANTVTVRLTAVLAATPVASLYDVRLLP